MRVCVIVEAVLPAVAVAMQRWRAGDDGPSGVAHNAPRRSLPEIGGLLPRSRTMITHTHL